MLSPCGSLTGEHGDEFEKASVAAEADLPSAWQPPPGGRGMEGCCRWDDILPALALPDVQGDLFLGDQAVSHVALAPFVGWTGQRNPKMLVIGEAWGENEANMRKPFVGESGKLLFELLGQALPDLAPELHASICSHFRFGLAWTAHRDEWLARAGISFTNVLAFRPDNNQLETCCGSKAEVSRAAGLLPPLTKSKYLRAEFMPEIERFGEELRVSQPNLVIAAGNTACWALLRATNIGSIRGAIAESPVFPGLKVLPTYHPAGVLRQWAWRPIVVADLMKAAREAEFPDIRRPKRRVLINPTIEELRAWVDSFLQTGASMVSCDTETGAGQIKCVGFAGARDSAIVVPFVDLTLETGSYWATPEEEREAWVQVGRVLSSKVIKLFQNGVYDLQYLLPTSLKLVNCLEDTMLLHHSLFPEMQKGLGFLGSIYTNEPAWKLMTRRVKQSRRKRMADQFKRGEKRDE